MSKLAKLAELGVVLLALGAMACGGGQEGNGAGEGDEGMAAAPEVVQNCLDLVADMQWSEAVPVCTDAVREAPQSAEARDALEQARSEAARMAEEAAAAAGESGEEAAEEAGEAAEEATGAMEGAAEQMGGGSP